MRKLLASSLVLVLALSLTACGKGDSDTAVLVGAGDNSSTEASEEASVEESESSTEEETSTEEESVAVEDTEDPVGNIMGTWIDSQGNIIQFEEGTVTNEDGTTSDVINFDGFMVDGTLTVYGTATTDNSTYIEVSRYIYTEPDPNEIVVDTPVENSENAEVEPVELEEKQAEVIKYTIISFERNAETKKAILKITDGSKNYEFERTENNNTVTKEDSIQEIIKDLPADANYIVDDGMVVIETPIEEGTDTVTE